MVEPLYSNKTVEKSTNGTPDYNSRYSDNVFFGKVTDSLFGVSPSVIDEYSGIVFPVFFVCFSLMYYFRISDHILTVLAQ